MKFKVQREDVLRPLQLVGGVVERRQTLPILSNVLLDATQDRLAITATDLELEMVVHTSLDGAEAGRTTLPARKFMDICRALPDGSMLDIVIEKDRAVLRSGKSRFVLSTLPAAEFPSIEALRETLSFAVPQKLLKSLIERTQFAMAQQDVRYYLNGLLIELADGELRAVATDGHRLALCKGPIDTDFKENQQIIVPRKGVAELSRLLEDTELPLEVQIGSNHIRVATPSFSFTSKLIDGRFPDYQRVIPHGTDKHVIADRNSLRQALVRTSILSNEKYRSIRLALAQGSLRVLAHNPEQEEAEEELGVNYDGGNLEIGFNANYLLDALGTVTSDDIHIKLSDPNSCCLIHGEEADDCKYVIMPMRL